MLIEVKLNGTKYKEILMRKVIPILNATCGKENYIWQQDDASARSQWMRPGTMSLAMSGPLSASSGPGFGSALL